MIYFCSMLLSWFRFYIFMASFSVRLEARDGRFLELIAATLLLKTSKDI